MTKNEIMKKRLASLLEGWDSAKASGDCPVLLIVPPFHSLKYPSLGLHLLQACGREAGFRVEVLYANMLLAAIMGEELYEDICHAPKETFAGERFFARPAFGLPPLGRRAGRMFESDWVIGPNQDWTIEPEFDRLEGRKPVTLQELRRWEKYVDGYVDCVATAVAARRYQIVGCTTTFQQTAGSVALLGRIKSIAASTITILGGANCDGEMGEEIASMQSGIDYIFSGESEVTFVRFVRDVLAGTRPAGRIVPGEICNNMDALPRPAFEEFYEQRQRFLPLGKIPVEETEIPYETSRGCWWGKIHHCTFCGFNEDAIGFRQKSPGRVMEDLRALLAAYPPRNINMSDAIMPHSYFRTLLPLLAAEPLGATIFYEQKANLTLAHVLALKQAGIASLQPGIEALSSRLLKLMDKGLTGRQNLVLLRFARAAGVSLYWNLLWGFPGDEIEAYEETLRLIPLLHHLQPPRGLRHLSIQRFSPYHFSPDQFGVRNIRPLAGYHDTLPKGVNLERMAYHFTAEYPCGAHDHMKVIYRLWQALARWQAAWQEKDGPPNQDLKLSPQGGSYGLADTRDLWRKKRTYSLDEQEASALVTAGPCSGDAFEAWAVEQKLAVIADGWFVPLAVAEPEILQALMGKQKQDRSGGFSPPPIELFQHTMAG